MIYHCLEDFPGFTLTADSGFVDLEKFQSVDFKKREFLFSYFSSLPYFLETLSPSVETVKIQMAGPFTLANHLICSDRRSLFSHQDLYGHLLKFLYYKTEALLEFFPSETEVIVVFDEPLLSEENAVVIFETLDSFVKKFRNRFKKKIIYYGLHSCNEWTPSIFSLFYQKSMDILSFDVKKGFEPFFCLSVAQREAFFKKKWILWGIVSDFLNPHQWNNLGDSPDIFVQTLENKGLQKGAILSILKRSLFSPACGTARLSFEKEKKCVEYLRQVSLYSRNLL